VRYGNVIGSRGSLIELLLKAKKEKHKSVYITDEAMTRFWITLEGAGNLVMFALENMKGGEVFVPKIPSMKLVDLFDAIVPEIPHKKMGMRPGEKLHEALLSVDEARRTYDLDKYYVMVPEQDEFFKIDTWFEKKPHNGKKLKTGFSYLSDENEEWLTKEQLKEIVDNFDSQI
jgi:UDP-N-acetylglucosamine 4,6-dehydratase